MAKTIDIIDEEFEILVNHYNSEIQAIEAQIADLSARKLSFVKRVQELLNPIQKPVREVTQSDVKEFKTDFKKLSVALSNAIEESFESFKTPRKIEHIFSISKKDLSTREVFEKMVELDENIRNKEKVTIEAISSYLSAGVKKGDFKIASTMDANGKKRFRKINAKGDMFAAFNNTLK